MEEQLIECSGCRQWFTESMVKNCNLCEESRCDDCLNEAGYCVPCTEAAGYSKEEATYI